jgi:hypothetical protein
MNSLAYIQELITPQTSGISNALHNELINKFNSYQNRDLSAKETKEFFDYLREKIFNDLALMPSNLRISGLKLPKITSGVNNQNFNLQFKFTDISITYLENFA